MERGKLGQVAKGSVISEVFLLEMFRINSLDPGYHIEVRVGRDDLFYMVVDHGGSMEGVSRLNSGMGFKKVHG